LVTPLVPPADVLPLKVKPCVEGAALLPAASPKAPLELLAVPKVKVGGTLAAATIG